MKSLLKAICFGVLGANMVVLRRIGKIRSAGLMTILNLHRVAPADGSAYSPIAPEIFKELLGFLKREFHICSFAELAETPNDKPILILSFDDGYRDFIDYAMPILDEFDIKVNQNVIPNCIISGQPPLNVFVQDFIGRADEVDLIHLEIPDFDMRIAKSRPIKASAAIKNRPMAEQNSLAAKIVPKMLDCNGFRPTPMMTADQVQEASRYHEIGVHSFEHATMDFETDEYLFEDALRCRAYMKKTLAIEVDIYAFPNGSYRASQIALLSEAGYETILLVGDAFSQKDSKVHPRFGFDAAGIFEAQFRAVGGFAPVQHWDNQ